MSITPEDAGEYKNSGRPGGMESFVAITDDDPPPSAEEADLLHGDDRLSDLDPLLSSPALYYSNDLSSPSSISVSTTDASAVATVFDPDDPVAMEELAAAEAAYVDPNARPIYSKLFNAILLCVSFGFAFYTLINVDAGMTRGWTQQEIAMRVPLDAWTSYESSLAEKPVMTKTIINVVIYLLGDWLSQTVFRGSDVLEFDAARTLRNGFIGMCFGPLVHQYYDFSDYILPVDVGVNRVYKILMDQTVYLFVKCSIYLVAVAVLAGEKFGKAVDDTRDRIWGVMFTAWKFWPLVHCITYTVIPAPHRVLWVNSVDLIWNAILATKASGDEAEEEGGGGDEEVPADGDLASDGVVVVSDTPAEVAAKKRPSGFDLAWLSRQQEEWLSEEVGVGIEVETHAAVALNSGAEEVDGGDGDRSGIVGGEEESIMSIYGGGEVEVDVAEHGDDEDVAVDLAAEVALELLELADGEGGDKLVAVVATNDTSSKAVA